MEEQTEGQMEQQMEGQVNEQMEGYRKIGGRTTLMGNNGSKNSGGIPQCQNSGESKLLFIKKTSREPKLHVVVYEVECRLCLFLIGRVSNSIAVTIYSGELIFNLQQKTCCHYFWQRVDAPRIFKSAESQLLITLKAQSHC